MGEVSMLDRLRWSRYTFALALVASCSYSRPGDLRSIGGTVSNLAGTGLILQINGRNDLAVPVGATTFQFDGFLVEGASYAVTVVAQPTNPVETCTVANGTGTVATADVTDVAVTCASVPPTVSGPSDQTVYAGLTATFSVMASGNGPFTYQWRRDGTDIPAATSPSYTTQFASEADDGSQFSVVVADGFGGSTTSTSAMLSVRIWSEFAQGGDMTHARAFHTATVLTDGKVLIVGGSNGNPLLTAEVYDPSYKTFAGTDGSLTVGRQTRSALAGVALAGFRGARIGDSRRGLASARSRVPFRLSARNEEGAGRRAVCQVTPWIAL